MSGQSKGAAAHGCGFVVTGRRLGVMGEFLYSNSCDSISGNFDDSFGTRDENRQYLYLNRHNE